MKERRIDKAEIDRDLMIIELGRTALVAVNPRHTLLDCSSSLA